MSIRSASRGVAALTLLCILGIVPRVTGQTSQSPALQPGAITVRVRTACAECHDTSILVQQRLDNRTWTKEVDKMMRWGALVEPADRDAIINYLSQNFGPDKQAFHPPMPAALKHARTISKQSK